MGYILGEKIFRRPFFRVGGRVASKHPFPVLFHILNASRAAASPAAAIRAASPVKSLSATLQTLMPQRFPEI